VASFQETTKLASVKEPSSFYITLGHQSREEKTINGSENSVSYPSPSSMPGAPARSPFVLFLDGIQDPGNLGAILRTAHFFGIDAVALSGSCAPLTPVALKSSAGAAELVPILHVSNASSFLEQSKESGWKVWAAAAPPVHNDVKGWNSWNAAHVTTRQLSSNALKEPTILMLGSEGEGLRKVLFDRATAKVGIPGGAGSLDSLNVSVAAGVLCEAFLKTVDPEEYKKSRKWSERSLDGTIEAGSRDNSKPQTISEELVDEVSEGVMANKLF
jgi:21S rRNA (GM2251-2'-O)-methyltransferase